MRDLNRWLLACDYPQQVIKKGIHNAKLQGPAPKPKSETIIPLISTFYSNYCNNTIVNVAENLLKNSNNERLKNAFKEVTFINSLRQPPNLLRELGHSEFLHKNKTKLLGLFKCKDKRCKICKLYLQECKSFETANGFLWEIRCYIDCNSINVLYYLVCNFCKKTTYTGKTDKLRLRTNNHITGCRHGNTTDIFDIHVHNCSKQLNIPLIEPYFQLYAFLSINEYKKLRNYESLLHSRGYDTMNC